MNKEYYIYILTNQNNNVLYIGVTNNLANRLRQHREAKILGFTKKYYVNKLVYYEIYENVYDAINREKHLKNWHRDWKNNLVESINKRWKDLSNEIN